MSIWSRLVNLRKKDEDTIIMPDASVTDADPGRYCVVDVEVSARDQRIHDIGAVRYDGAVMHSASVPELLEFIKDTDFLCGHNIIHHDARYIFRDTPCRWILVDTLYFSPLLFPERPYHRLVKDDKLDSEDVNNPVNDSRKALTLLMEEVDKWNSLDNRHKQLLAALLHGKPEFSGFLRFVEAPAPDSDAVELIRELYAGKICTNADIKGLVEKYPCAMAYALALVGTSDRRSITPGWVLHNYPEVDFIIKLLRHTPCTGGCSYCNTKLDLHAALKNYFGYDRFRTYEGEPLQQMAAQAAVDGKSLLAIFPTGGGKSLTFQLPALMEGSTVHGLTVVISPLQSLMKDQVDNLAARGIVDAVTINGMTDPITRAATINMVMDGDASILYISPEMLRSKTIERILLNRHVVRFVIDEAHCFSSWGQDFRVDYLYIGRFIKEYQEKKKCKSPIPVSCFTATAKQKVIQDIRDYFRQTLGLDLQLFASSASRTNLHYSVIHTDDDSSKYARLRELVAEADCPTIIYVSRTKRTVQLAAKLTRDGFKAYPFHGKMTPEEKIHNQEAFMTDNVGIIVATSAFGMGVDKRDVGMVIHYDISDSLENYVQEAGRAGRDPSLNARCYVLYSDNDLDKHFILLNQTKLSISEIQQIWKVVKELTGKRMAASCSALEIARQAGWDDSVSDIETRVRTAISALEQSGYLVRGNNVPHVYATGITVRNVDEARTRITTSSLFGKDEIENAVRVIRSLISQKYTGKNKDAESESRVDYLADVLGLKKREVISVVERMRQEGILADSRDISAYLFDSGNAARKSSVMLERFARLEQYILTSMMTGELRTSARQLNDKAIKDGIGNSKEKDLRTLLYFLTIKGYIRKVEQPSSEMTLCLQADVDTVIRKFKKRIEICRFAVDWLYKIAVEREHDNIDDNSVRFSVIELLNKLKQSGSTIFGSMSDVTIEEVEEALLYLSKIGALKLEGGFLVLYNAMNIRRLKDNKVRYKQDDYRMLNEFYRHKIQQVHIVGEYANLMVRDYDAALRYVHDYFNMDYRQFVSKYFKGERQTQIQRNLTPGKYEQLFGALSQRQMEIISDKSSRCIVVAAGPGSGKTRVLVHKLASLLLLEDVKHEQLLMLTFSRAAATEFKSRLMQLIGNAAHFVEIKTFHSYCFDLLGRIGSIEDSDEVVADATALINSGEVEPKKIGKTVLVIDEAQDMSQREFDLVRALMTNNEDMRVIAVGDDDQNIFAFRGSDSGYMYSLSREPGARLIEMTENYRSCRRPVRFANDFLKLISKRIKHNQIVSMSGKDGVVEITTHTGDNMFHPVVKEVKANCSGRLSGVLARTNREAAMMTALLQRNGINARLIQSLDGFPFSNIAEVRYFIKFVSRHITTPVISDELWSEARHATIAAYRRSTALPYLVRSLDLFEQTNRSKYFTDFKEFVFESSVEDFCDMEGADVVVSTIHKSKGREFDDVYMLLTDKGKVDNEELRTIYVGLTRAKERLFVHTDGHLFSRMKDVVRHHDATDYESPREVMLQLTHRDVFLGFFKDRKKEILSLQSGDMLIFENGGFYNPVTRNVVARLSAKMAQELARWLEAGYRVKSAAVRFVVAWKPKDAPRHEAETAVLLIDMLLERRRL